MEGQQSNKQIQNYQLEKIIGQGQFGTVFQARDLRTDKLVACKIAQKTKLIQDQYLLKLFKEEVRTQRLIQNDNVVRFIDFLETKNNFYVIMEFCAKKDLASYLMIKKFLPEKESIDKLKQLLNGFKGIHEFNIIHRDFKAANIFIDSEGNLKIGDFGFAKQACMTMSCIGTPLNMAPEILSFPCCYTNKSDIYSLGVVFYQMLYGVYPYESSSPQGILYNIQNGKRTPNVYNVQLSQECFDLVNQMLQANPASRIDWVQIYQHPALLNRQTIPQTIYIPNSKQIFQSVIQQKPDKLLQIAQLASEQQDFEQHQRIAIELKQQQDKLNLKLMKSMRFGQGLSRQLKEMCVMQKNIDFYNAHNKEMASVINPLKESISEFTQKLEEANNKIKQKKKKKIFDHSQIFQFKQYRQYLDELVDQQDLLTVVQEQSSDNSKLINLTHSFIQQSDAKPINIKNSNFLNNNLNNKLSQSCCQSSSNLSEQKFFDVQDIEVIEVIEESQKDVLPLPLPNQWNVAQSNIDFKKALGQMQLYQQYNHKRGQYQRIGNMLLNHAPFFSSTFDRRIFQFVLAKEQYIQNFCLLRQMTNNENIFKSEHFISFQESNFYENLRNEIKKEHDLMQIYFAELLQYLMATIETQEENAQLAVQNKIEMEELQPYLNNTYANPHWRQYYKEQICNNYMSLSDEIECYKSQLNNQNQNQQQNQNEQNQFLKANVLNKLALMFEILDCADLERNLPFLLKIQDAKWASDKGLNESGYQIQHNIIFNFQKYEDWYRSLSFEQIEKENQMKFHQLFLQQ